VSEKVAGIRMDCPVETSVGEERLWHHERDIGKKISIEEITTARCKETVCDQNMNDELTEKIGLTIG